MGLLQILFMTTRLQSRRAFVQALTFGGGAVLLMAGRHLLGPKPVNATESAEKPHKQGIRTLNTSARLIDPTKVDPTKVDPTKVDPTKIDWHIED